MGAHGPATCQYDIRSAILDQAGIPTVIFGPGGAGAHETLEWVDLVAVDRCAEVLVAVATEFCG